MRGAGTRYNVTTRQKDPRMRARRVRHVRCTGLTGNEPLRGSAIFRGVGLFSSLVWYFNRLPCLVTKHRMTAPLRPCDVAPLSFRTASFFHVDKKDGGMLRPRQLRFAGTRPLLAFAGERDELIRLLSTLNFFFRTFRTSREM